jgi:hypothetical protein
MKSASCVSPLCGISTILTSQIPVDKWYEVIGDPTYADAILDRLVHNAHRIDLAGDSLRRTRSRSRKEIRTVGPRRERVGSVPRGLQAPVLTVGTAILQGIHC